MKFNLTVIFYLVCSVYCTFFADAQSEPPGAKIHAHIDLDNPLNTISKYLTGSHFVYAVESDELYKDERIARWMLESKVGTIRYPGGTVVMAYHWDALNGIPFRTDSWDPEYNSEAKDPVDFMDVDEYIAYCSKVKAEPMIGINILSGRRYDREKEALDEARRLIEHCKNRGYDVKFWYIGNEGYAKGFTAKAYAAYVDKYAGVLKSVIPDIVVIGDWKLGPIWKDRFNECIEIAKMSEHLDVLEVHEKWGNEWGMTSGQSMEDWKSEFPIYDGKLGMYIRRFHEQMEQIGKPNIKFGLNEWGLGNVTGSNKNENAVLVADYLIEIFRNDVYMANYWNLNMGPAQTKILDTTDDKKQLLGLNPTAGIFEMYASAMGKRLLRVDCSRKEVYGFSAIDEQDLSVQLFLMHKSEGASKIEVSGLGGDYIAATIEAFDISGNILAEDIRGEADSGYFSLLLQPWSVNKIIFKLK